ncbi:MAG: glycosyltransferase family 4 protein [Gemmataceae bacterium]|nr:glycosyltransferase family 4 protein [Gemmataceae bacterium]
MTSLLISEIFPPAMGGSSRWFGEIYRRLPRDQFVIAAGQNPGQEEFDRAHDLRTVRLPLKLSDWGVLGMPALRTYRGLFRELQQIVREHDVRAVHCGRCLPEGWLALWLKGALGVPYMCYVHGEDVNCAAGGVRSGVMSSRQLRWMTWAVLRGADFVIANCRNTRRVLRQQWRLPRERVRVLHPGVDTAHFTPARPDTDVRARFGWTGRTVVLTVGRLQKRKGHDCMIRALHALRRDFPDILYAIAGDGEERQALTELTTRENLGAHVQFLGSPTDEQLVRCYQQCDLFALPNRRVGSDIEGFGMVLLEAQACGKPVLAGDSGGTAEAMAIPETGRVVACDTPEPLAAAVLALLRDASLRARMGQAGRHWVVEHFDWDTLTRQATRLFRFGRTARALAEC